MQEHMTASQVRALLTTAGRALKVQTEKAFTKQVLDLAKLRGWRRAHFRPARVMRNGMEKYETPVAGDGKGFLDLLLLRRGRLVVPELKIPPNELTPDQRLWFEAWEEYGAEVFVWTPADWSEIESVLL